MAETREGPGILQQQRYKKMSTKLINRNGAEMEYGNVPDCWHVYTWLKDNAPGVSLGGVSLADMVLDCWHQAHDYKAIVLQEGEAKRVIDGTACDLTYTIALKKKALPTKGSLIGVESLFDKIS